MSTQYIPSIGMFCKNWGGCEEEQSLPNWPLSPCLWSLLGLLLMCI